MRNVVGVVAVVGAVLAVGCSSESSSGGGSGGGGFGSEPDFNSIAGQFDAPTGTFEASQTSTALTGLNEQQNAAKNSSGFNPFGGSSSTSSLAPSLHALSLDPLALSPMDGLGSLCKSGSASQSSSGNSASGSCACPSGGTVTYDFSGLQQMQSQSGKGPIDVTLKMRYAACGDGKKTIDGGLFIKMKTDGTNTPAGSQILYSVHITVTGEKNEKLDIEYALIGGRQWFVVKVNDGHIAMSAEGWNPETKTGKITIKDRNGTWSCNLTNGKGTCTDEKGKSITAGG